MKEISFQLMEGITVLHLNPTIQPGKTGFLPAKKVTVRGLIMYCNVGEKFQYDDQWYEIRSFYPHYRSDGTVESIVHAFQSNQPKSILGC